MNLRMRRNLNLDEDTMVALQACLRRVNGYARLFLHAKDFIRDRHVGQLSIRLLADATTDLHRYNTPSVDEIAVPVLTCGNVSNWAYPRDVVLHSHTDRLEYITDLHPAYVPLHYVLLFPWFRAFFHEGCMTAIQVPRVWRVMRVRYAPVDSRKQVMENGTFRNESSVAFSVVTRVNMSTDGRRPVARLESTHLLNTRRARESSVAI
jgi:hypothetical protein